MTPEQLVYNFGAVILFAIAMLAVLLAITGFVYLFIGKRLGEINRPRKGVAQKSD